MQRPERAGNHRQHGQATLEYLYVLPVLLLLMLASLQFVLVYQAKQSLSYATFVATRAGALQNGSLPAIQDALISGFTPYFVHDDTLQAMKDARVVAKTEMSDNKLVRIEIVNPTPGALSGFDDGQGEIPNDNLMYRDPGKLADNMNVQDANLLKIRVSYCVRLVVPIINRMIYSFTTNPATTPAKIDTYSGGPVAAPELLKAASPGSASGLCISPADPYPYRLKITAEAVVRMQSPFRNTGAWALP
ncbi:MAG: pilus assembly protein [Proteobacteria bacterium]|nr:pilus assembly protein [Pseudomonadota bacterium]HQR03488.1 TadE/TadG family type IV pilus assembly protein [Rhodocyclaceae bacterium]